MVVVDVVVVRARVVVEVDEALVEVELEVVS